MKDFHGHIPGFEGSSEQGYKDGLIQTITRKQLTRSIGKYNLTYLLFLPQHNLWLIGCAAQVTKAMSEEAAVSMSMNIGEPNGTVVPGSKNTTLEQNSSESRVEGYTPKAGNP